MTSSQVPIGRRAFDAKEGEKPLLRRILEFLPIQGLFGEEIGPVISRMLARIGCGDAASPIF